jgi:putative DNA-invertase from lambdoid prophage Rac
MTITNLRVGIYARVSTAEQQTLPMQIAAMREYAERRGWTVTTSIEDVGSGAKQRPKRQELITLAKRRQIDVILVWRLDRWGRSVTDLIGTLQELTAIGVGFVSITESLDLTTPSGRALAGMLAVFAEFERDILRERVKAGIMQARKRGKLFGRPAIARAKSDKIEELFAQGLNKSQISQRLGISRSSVLRAWTVSENTLIALHGAEQTLYLSRLANPIKGLTENIFINGKRTAPSSQFLV